MAKTASMSALDTATRKFIAICRDTGNEEVKRAAVEYAKAVELYISDQEMDILHQHVKIKELLKDVQLHVDVMRSYGIDSGLLGHRSIYSILGDIQMANDYGHYRIPEKLIEAI